MIPRLSNQMKTVAIAVSLAIIVLSILGILVYQYSPTGLAINVMEIGGPGMDCKEDDLGMDPSARGTTKGLLSQNLFEMLMSSEATFSSRPLDELFELDDGCMDENRLVEFFCNGDSELSDDKVIMSIDYNEIECEHGCFDGACISKTDNKITGQIVRERGVVTREKEEEVNSEELSMDLDKELDDFLTDAEGAAAFADENITAETQESTGMDTAILDISQLKLDTDERLIVDGEFYEGDDLELVVQPLGEARKFKQTTTIRNLDDQNHTVNLLWSVDISAYDGVRINSVTGTLSNDFEKTGVTTDLVLVKSDTDIARLDFTDYLMAFESIKVSLLDSELTIEGELPSVVAAGESLTIFSQA